MVYVGRLAATKGIFETIEAARILRDRGVEVCLTVAGTGAEMPAVCKAIEAAGLGTRARVAGAVFGAAKEQLWQRAHVLAFPTYHQEGLPYALLECMAAGAVPVVSPVGAIPDVVQDEVHGLFVPSRDPEALAEALERLARDRELLHRLATAAHARVTSSFSVTRLAAEFKGLYESIA
jgi:glycosyltransferase involved in cell wall biosynthesis